jgi:hypothetical protein
MGTKRIVGRVTASAHASASIVGSFGRILHGQMSESSEARGTLLDFPGQKIVGSFCPLQCDALVSFHLNSGAGNRKHLEVNPVHNRNASLTKFLQSLQAELRDLRAYILIGLREVVDEFRNQEVLL